MQKDMSRKDAEKCPEYSHVLPKHLADYLFVKREGKYYKYDAFYSLIEKQAVEVSKQDWKPYSPILVSLTRLANEWGWHRHTVRIFLETLRDLSVIELRKEGRNYLVFFPYLTVKAA